MNCVKEINPFTKLFNMSQVEKNYQISGNCPRLQPYIRTKVVLKKYQTIDQHPLQVSCVK